MVVLIIFPVILQTVNSLIMLSITGQRQYIVTCQFERNKWRYEEENTYCFSVNKPREVCLQLREVVNFYNGANQKTLLSTSEVKVEASHVLHLHILLTFLTYPE